MAKHPKLSSLIDKAVFDYNMIEDGDRILIGASGGKDSTALVEYFAQRAKRPLCNYTYKAVTVQSDFAPPVPSGITDLFYRWNVPYETINADVIGRLKPGRKMNCWWCSTQRRTELLNYAVANGYNKLALGHHLDDILETLLMNMLGKGELSTMPPVLAYDEYPVTILRPLCYASVGTIIEHARQQGYNGWTCTCSYQDNSGRKEARKLLQDLTGGSGAKKERMFASLKNIRTEYLP
ncbi:MAG: tRNA 2-thiocytidine biosynthesis protein TtcA [Treponema sp.]|nr:tRNA 2-thiocytidine biosynthesis protein TtcA [Treponema sp.]